jgi:hypothetical protein
MNTPPIVTKYNSIYRLYTNVVSIQEKDGVFTAYDKDGKEVTINMSDVDADFAKIDYQNKRHKEYPDWKTQMDMQYWDAINGTTKWKDLITKIKSDNPKP